MGLVGFWSVTVKSMKFGGWGVSNVTRTFATSNSVKRSQRQIRAIIIGPPGSGKGTISERIVKEFKLFHLSSGDALRKHIRGKTELGQQIAPLVVTGQLIPTSLMAPLIDQELKKLSEGTGWLLDGYPRNTEQADLLDKDVNPNLVIHLNVPFATIIDRVKSRYVHEKSGRVYNLDFNPPKVPGKDDVTGEDLMQREDDKPESVKKRLELYESTTKPVIEHYKRAKLLKEFAGTESNVIWPVVREAIQRFLL